MTDVLIPYSFVPGTKAMASEVNANFIALANAVDDCKIFTTQSIEDFNENVETRLDETLGDKLNINLSNSGNIANCIIEIPQRIKLELVDDCVVLKAGSVVIVPNGFEEDGTTQKFDYVTIESDLTQSIAFNGSYDDITLCYNADTETLGVFRRTTENGSGTESVTIGYYYNTSTNLVSYYADSTADGYRYSLPLGIFSNSAASITSINNVFNGFSFIGQCTFVDKGVKALRANGRNEDGTLNNIETVSNKISVVNLVGQTSILSFFTGEKLYGYGVDNYIIQDSKPTITTTYAMWYSPKDNYTYSTADTGATWRVTDRFYVGQLTKTDATGNITFMTPKKSFRAVDYSEFKELALIPDYSAGISQTKLPVSGSKFTAPDNGLYCASFSGDENTTTLYINELATGIIVASPGSGRDQFPVSVILKKGDVIYWNRSAGIFKSSVFYPFERSL